MKRPSRPAGPVSVDPGVSLHELRVTVSEEHGELVSALVIRAGGGGVMEDPAGRRVRLTTYGEESKLADLARYLRDVLGPIAKIEVRPSAKRLAGWETAWTARLEAVFVTPTLVVAPTTAVVSEPTSAALVRLEPAVAFGFGEHPTTRLAAAAIERIARRGEARTLLDFGTGSGVLALAFLLTGGARAVGIDVDPRAVAAATANAALNGVARRVRFSSAPLSRVRQTFDVVVANVDRGTILAHAAGLARAVGPDGTLLVTGFLRGDVADVTRAISEQGLARARRIESEGDWVLLAFSRPPTELVVAAGRARRATPATARGTTRTRRSR